MPSPGEYQVVYPETVRLAWGQAIDALLAAGWDKAPIGALMQFADDQLRHFPLEFGEPLYTLRAMNLNVRVGFVRPFCIQFGVHEDLPIVFVRKLILMTSAKD